MEGSAAEDSAAEDSAAVTGVDSAAEDLEAEDSVVVLVEGSEAEDSAAEDLVVVTGVDSEECLAVGLVGVVWVGVVTAVDSEVTKVVAGKVVSSAPTQ